MHRMDGPQRLQLNIKLRNGSVLLVPNGEVASRLFITVGVEDIAAMGAI